MFYFRNKKASRLLQSGSPAWQRSTSAEFLVFIDL